MIHEANKSRLILVVSQTCDFDLGIAAKSRAVTILKAKIASAFIGLKWENARFNGRRGCIASNFAVVKATAANSLLLNEV